MKKRLWIVFVIAAILLFAGCQREQQYPSQDIAVIYTNDVHCSVDENIGYAGVAALEKELASQGNQTLLVDCGDHIQGQPIGAMSQGEIPIKIMNRIGYDVAVPGNHEYDYGTARFKELAEIAEFPYVAVNYVGAGTGKGIFEPYIIKEVSGVKIAFIGVITPNTINSTRPVYFMDENGNYIYDFMGADDGQQLFDAVQKNIDKANKEADYVIILSHLGILDADAPFNSTTLISNISGADVVLDGHSHSVVEGDWVTDKAGNKVLLTQTGTGLENVGVLTIKTDGSIGTRLVSGYESKDSETTAYINSEKAAYEDILAQKVAYSKDDLITNDPKTGVRIIRNAETNLGNLCADAYRSAGNSDIAILNGGGIRDELKAGDLTYGDILAVSPFGNELCVVEATGQEIVDALEVGARNMPEEEGSFLHVSGMTYQVDVNIKSSVVLDDKGNFVRVDGESRVKNVTVGGQPIDLNKTYTVTSHNYILKEGGGGQIMFKDNKFLLDGFAEDYAVLIEYIKSYYANDTGMYKEPYGEGRITAVE